jgi:hypothetical protein
MISTVLQYPNEVTALSAGAALFALGVGPMTTTPISEILSPMVLENAAAHLSRHPEAALRFRELLQLHTPWA